MFNSGYKKEALSTLERASEAYSKQYNKTIDNAEKLHNLKEQSVQILKSVEDYYNSLANKPRQFIGIISSVSERRKNFEKEVETLKLESKNSENLPLYKIFPPKVYDIAAYPKVGRLIDKSTIFNITIPIAINADKNKPNFICFFFKNDTPSDIIGKRKEVSL